MSRAVEEVTWDEDAAEKSGFPTFMLKEIHEQPDAVAETIADRLPELDRVDLSELELDRDYIAGLRRIVIVACGTSYHAGLVGRYAIEQWARVPVEMDIASEYRYRDPVVGPDDLVIGITQSGETADTPRGDAPRARARREGARDHQHHGQPGDPRLRHGPVHARRARDRGRGDEDLRQPGRRDVPVRAVARGGPRQPRPPRPDRLIAELKAIPTAIDALLESVDERVRAIARSHHEQRFFLYLGRNIGLPVCLEGR